MLNDPLLVGAVPSDKLSAIWGPFCECPENILGRRKAICEIANRLFWKADHLTCFQSNKKKDNCEVWRIKCPPFLRYKGNCDTRTLPVKFRDFRKTAPWIEEKVTSFPSLA